MDGKAHGQGGKYLKSSEKCQPNWIFSGGVQTYGILFSFLCGNKNSQYNAYCWGQKSFISRVECIASCNNIIKSLK